MGSDPTEEIELLKKVVQKNIDTIWQQISRIDSMGREQIMETCGGYELEDLLLTARDLAKFLTTIRRSLDITSTSLSCPRINPLYSLAAHDTVCTNVATATASGFFLFLLLGLSLMTMMSLRASWLQNIKEEKVYHDESEVAENMILDEHEEYLAYISKYKHEWQEYRGFDEKPINPQMEVDDEGSYSDGSDESSYDNDVECYNSGSMDGSVQSSIEFQISVVHTESTNDMR